MVVNHYTDQFAVDYNKKWRSSDLTFDMVRGREAEILNPYKLGSIVWGIAPAAIDKRINTVDKLLGRCLAMYIVDNIIANCLVNARNQL